MKLSQLGPMQQYELIERMARAIAKVYGFDFTGVDIQNHARVNPRAAEYVRAAIATLEEVKEFGVL